MSATEITAAGLEEPAAAAPSPAQLAARIQVPTILPPRYDGEPIAHLSHSSYNRFALCPEDWRRHYILGERHPPTGAMFLGRRVDDAITLYYRQILERGERLTVEQVKTTPLTQYKADHDFQPAVYLAGRWLEADPATAFAFAQIAKPGPRRKQMSAALVTTSRSVGQLRGALARIAQVARQIVVSYERFGPDEPWGFADPSGWKCSARYCEAWGSCPGGAGV
jgi:hypothetical protein